MSDELPGICCMCGGSSEIVYARAVDVHTIEAICRTCYPDKNPPQIARLIQENAKLEDLLRWRDSKNELPIGKADYLVQYLEFSGGGFARMVVYWDGSWPPYFPNYRSCYWRPIGPLPGGE